MSFVRGSLTEDQKRKIEANRQKALERLKKKTMPNDQPASNSTKNTSSQITPQIKSTSSSNNNVQKFQRRRITLTPEQRKRIEENRKRAIEIQRRNQQNNRDASGSTMERLKVPGSSLNREEQSNRSKVLRPSIKRKDYIEYDFSTMKDTRGGFISNEDTSNPLSANADNKTLEEWKERQKQQHIIRDLPPPMDISKAPKCFECDSLEIDPNLYNNFNQVRVCRKCAKANPNKYSLLTKTECREDYLLTDPELKDKSLLPRIEKPNPHGFSRMQLFLRYQVEEFAWKKWGSPEDLDNEWERRETMKIKRRDKRYNEKLREIRKKTRAEEYTRKLRNGQSLDERHVHDWSAPLAVPGDLNIVKKRCIDCGVETEEVII